MNVPTIIVAAIVAAVFIAIVITDIRRRKKGAGCSCGCGSCAMRDICHEKSSAETENL